MKIKILFKKKIKIEKYLILEQNNLLIKKLSESKSNIKYNLINSNITKIFIESEVNIKKLYLNTVSKFNEDISNKNDIDKYPFLNILYKVEVDYIINILLGKVLLIISYNNIHNKYTNLTEVCYSLGIELINKYIHNLYLSESYKYNSYNDYMIKITNTLIYKIKKDPTKLVGLGSNLIS